MNQLRHFKPTTVKFNIVYTIASTFFPFTNSKYNNHSLIALSVGAEAVSAVMLVLPACVSARHPRGRGREGEAHRGGVAPREGGVRRGP